MGAASTVPVDGTKAGPLDLGAQPKNVFSGSVSKIQQDAENKVRNSKSFYFANPANFILT